MYVCMYVCTYVRTYVCMYVCMYIYIYMHVYIYIYIYTYTYICYINVYDYTHTHAHITYFTTCVYVYIYIYIYNLRCATATTSTPTRTSGLSAATMPSSTRRASLAGCCRAHTMQGILRAGIFMFFCAVFAEVLQKITETCRDLQRLSFSFVKLPKYCGDLRRQRIRATTLQTNT